MKTIPTIAALIVTLWGAFFLFGEAPVLGTFGWYVYDTATTGGVFFCSLQWVAFWKHLKKWHRYFLGGFSLYCLMDWMGNILGINEHGNRYPYFYAAVLGIISLIVLLNGGKWIMKLYQNFRRPKL